MKKKEYRKLITDLVAQHNVTIQAIQTDMAALLLWMEQHKKAIAAVSAKISAPSPFEEAVMKALSEREEPKEPKPKKVIPLKLKGSRFENQPEPRINPPPAPPEPPTDTFIPVPIPETKADKVPSLRRFHRKNAVDTRVFTDEEHAAYQKFGKWSPHSNIGQFIVMWEAVKRYGVNVPFPNTALDRVFTEEWGYHRNSARKYLSSLFYEGKIQRDEHMWYCVTEAPWIEDGP